MAIPAPESLHPRTWLFECQSKWQSWPRMAWVILWPPRVDVSLLQAFSANFTVNTILPIIIISIWRPPKLHYFILSANSLRLNSQVFFNVFYLSLSPTQVGETLSFSKNSMSIPKKNSMSFYKKMSFSKQSLSLFKRIEDFSAIP